jgi:hypothetical protein
VCFVPGLDVQVRQPGGTNHKRQSSSSDAAEPKPKRPANTTSVPEQHVPLGLEETIAKLEEQVRQQNERMGLDRVLLAKSYAVEAQLNVEYLTTTSKHKESALEAKKAITKHKESALEAKKAITIARRAARMAKQKEAKANAQAIADLLEKDKENEALAKKVEEQAAQITAMRFNLANVERSLKIAGSSLDTFEHISNQMGEPAINILKVRYDVHCSCFVSWRKLYVHSKPIEFIRHSLYAFDSCVFGRNV